MKARINIEINYSPLESEVLVNKRIKQLADFACITISNCYPNEIIIEEVKSIHVIPNY